MLCLLVYEALFFTIFIHIVHFPFASKRADVPDQRAICIRSPCSL